MHQAGRNAFDLGGGVSVTTASQHALLGDLGTHMRAGLGFAVATANLDHLVKLRRDFAFRDAYARHTHVVADGNPVVWLHNLAGRPVDLVTGSDLVVPLAALAAELQMPVALFGSNVETLEIAARRLKTMAPSLSIVARIAPSAAFDPNGPEADEALTAIRASGARLCIVALGAPKQELFAARAIEHLSRCGVVSVGAGLDFIAGRQRRAPLWCRRLALEWLWRLAGDPRRLATRYRDCALILPGLVAAALRHRLGSASGALGDGLRTAEDAPRPAMSDGAPRAADS